MCVCVCDFVRSLMESMETAASQCPGFMRVIPRNRDDETHWDAIERELIKLGSEVCGDRVNPLAVCG